MKGSWIKLYRTEIQLVSAILLIVFGCVLMTLGFWVAPLGVIDNSVLIAFGEILTFSGALFGIDFHYRVLYGNKFNNEKKEG